MRRTQIYLDEDQKQALRLLAMSRDENVSDLVRQAIERLLRDEYAGKDWRAELDRVQGRVLQQLDGGAGDEEIAAAYRRARRQGKREGASRA